MRTTFFDVLTAHAAMYPKMEACDYVKLVYQNEFGCGHLLADRQAAYGLLLEEWDKVQPDVLEPLTVDIGGGFARLNLAAAKRGMTPELLFAMFEKSVVSTGTWAGFDRKISLLCRAAKMGILPCDSDAVAEYAASLNHQVPHHSACFKHLYGANYRVISSEMATAAPACQLLMDAGRKAAYVNVAIEGRAASGKTTMAALLADLFDGTVISMDDYFLPVEQKSPERLALPGGNLDAERFRQEIMASRYAENIAHARFDCHTQTLLSLVVEERKSFLFVEGVYSLRSDFRSFYDVKILLDTDSETQKLRIWDRGGEALLHRYETEWLPLEEEYFVATEPQLCADIIIIT